MAKPVVLVQLGDLSSNRARTRLWLMTLGFVNPRPRELLPIADQSRREKGQPGETAATTRLTPVSYTEAATHPQLKLAC